MTGRPLGRLLRNSAKIADHCVYKIRFLNTLVDFQNLAGNQTSASVSLPNILYITYPAVSSNAKYLEKYLKMLGLAHHFQPVGDSMPSPTTPLRQERT
jgi:hypothetical protein